MTSYDARVSKFGIAQTLKKRIKASWISFGDFIREETNLIGKSWKQVLPFILLIDYRCNYSGNATITIDNGSAEATEHNNSVSVALCN